MAETTNIVQRLRLARTRIADDLVEGLRLHCEPLPETDAYVWFEETSAVTPLPAGRPAGVPDTYPFGL